MINTFMSITLEKILTEILGKPPSFYFNNTIDMEVFFHKVNKPQIYNRYKRIIAQYTNFQSVTITHVDHAVLLFYICSKLTKNPQEGFPSFILACHESYNDYVKFRYKSKFLQQLNCMANTLKNLIYLQFYANAQWTDRPEPLIEKLNMFDNLRILSLSNITQPKLSTYTNTKETLSLSGFFANSKIEYLFLNCYPLRIIRYFPKLKFLQISNKIYDSTIQHYTLDLHKYFHPNAITLNTLSLINTKIIGNNAIYHHPKHNFRVIYNLRNIKIKKGGITNNMYSVKLQTHYNTTLDNISLNTYAYQFIHSIHLQKYNNTTLILLDKSQSSETIKQITQSVPNYTLINVQLNTVPYKFNEYHCRNTAQAQLITETVHEHPHDITTSSTTSTPDISNSNNVSLPNVTPDPQQTHVNIKDDHASHSSTTYTTTLQASDNDSSRINSLKAKSNITIGNLNNTQDNNSHNLATSSTTSAPDISSSNNVGLTNVTPDPQQTHVNIKDDHASHSSTTCTTTLQTSDNDSSRINSPKAKSDITIGNLNNTQDNNNNSHNLATSSTTSAPDISSSNNVGLTNVTPDPQQTHVNIKDDHASHSSTTCTTTLQTSDNDPNRTSPHNTDIIRSDPKFDKTSDHDTVDNSLRFPTILTLNYSNPNNINLHDTSMDVADDQDYSPFHQFSLPITENMSTDSSDDDTAFDSLSITESTSTDLSEEDNNVEFYVNQIIQDQNLDLSLITNYVLKSPDITHISYNIKISTPEYTILDNISSNISIPQQEPTTRGNPMKKINTLPTNTTKNNAYIASHKKVEKLLISNVSTTSSLHNTQSTEDPYNSISIPTIRNYSPSIANRKNITKQSFQGKQQTNNLLITEHRVTSSHTTRTTYFQHIPYQPTSTQTNEFQSLNALSIEELISIYLDEEGSDLQLDTTSTNEENQQIDPSRTKKDDTINSNMTNTSTTTCFEHALCQPTFSQINEFQLINSSSIEEFKKNYLDQEDINQPISTSIEEHQLMTTNTALKISSVYHHANLQDSLSSNTPLDLTNKYIPRTTCPPSPSYKMRISHNKMTTTPYSRPTQPNLLRR
ncbi:hypothetical protein EHRUM3_03100 [Ehrlichia ruminantium]|uniref:Uncharacterized protein n=2 Tax=Ehrlichia ruminantium TaxID=779 RepID=A0A170SKI6_EHRRU|nr:hypothetical protein EHRUM3_03100 [Ehrlichia ruminantium]